MSESFASTVLGMSVFLTVVGWTALYLGKDAAAKRWLWPRYLVSSFALLVVVAAASALASRSVWAFVGLLALLPVALGKGTPVVRALIQRTKFCGRCGAVVVPDFWFDPRRRCPRCGTDLEANDLAAPQGWRPFARVVGGVVLGVALVTLLDVRCSGPGRGELERMGDGLVAQVERFRSTYGRYPETLEAAGISQPTYHYFGFEYHLFEGGEGFVLSIGDYLLNGFNLSWDSKQREWYYDT